MSCIKDAEKKEERDRVGCGDLTNASNSMALDTNGNCIISCAFERYVDFLTTILMSLYTIIYILGCPLTFRVLLSLRSVRSFL